MKNSYDIIIKPVITEKTVSMMEEGKYTFRVAKGANKFEIKNAIQDIFKVNVVNVSTMNVRGKLKRMGRSEGKTASWKKAIVTLKDGQQIEVFEGL
jgi:large subunit ribosomal protein L23